MKLVKFNFEKCNIVEKENEKITFKGNIMKQNYNIN